MKIFAFIMSCVIFIASITPCKDVNAFNGKQATIVVKASPTHNCNGSADVCSPLCICNCCAGCSMYYAYPQLSHFNEQLSTSYSSFLNNSIHEVALPIWQPPQLS